MEIEIPESAKKRIEELFSSESMKKIAETQESFDTYDIYTNIHGSHINNAKYKEEFTYEEATRLYKLNKKLRKKWGYPNLTLEKIYNISINKKGK